MDKLQNTNIIDTMFNLAKAIMDDMPAGIIKDLSYVEKRMQLDDWRGKSLIWLASRQKTILLSEYAVMQKGIPDNEQLLYLRNTTEYRAYMVILPPSAAINGRGDIFELQLDAYIEYVRAEAVENDQHSMDVVYSDGSVVRENKDDYFYGRFDLLREQGKVSHAWYAPESDDDLEKVLFRDYEKQHPDIWESKSLDRHVAQILTAHVTREAERVTALMVENVTKYNKTGHGSTEIALSEGFIKKAGIWEYKLLWANIPGEYTAIAFDKQAGFKTIVQCAVWDIRQCMERGESNARVCEEINRIMGELYVTGSPNSPNSTHYMVDVTAMMGNLSREEIDIFWEKVPFDTMSISSVKDHKGVYAMVEADEIHKIRGTDVTDVAWRPAADAQKPGHNKPPAGMER